jgi:hypothetical protein
MTFLTPSIFTFVGCLEDRLIIWLGDRLLTGCLPASLHALFILHFDGGLHE